MAFIPKGSSRRVTCRFFIEGYSDNTYFFVKFILQKKNEKKLNRMNEEQLEGKSWCQQPR